MHFDIYDVFYSQHSDQHISAAIPTIFRVILLQEYKCTDLVNCRIISLTNFNAQFFIH